MYNIDRIVISTEKAYKNLTYTLLFLLFLEIAVPPPPANARGIAAHTPQNSSFVSFVFFVIIYYIINKIFTLEFH
jgi:hypothetical protein